MARRRTHLIVGTPSGAAVAAYMAREQPSWKLPAEAAGGALGGAVGALLPDVLEPAFNSWHRSIAHSYATAGVGVATIPQRLSSWQEYCRRQADLHERLRERSFDEWSRLWHYLCAFFWHVMSGFIAGAAVGYLSHLALDMMTPRGLPP